jgi:hypothetical protein
MIFFIIILSEQERIESSVQSHRFPVPQFTVNAIYYTKMITTTGNTTMPHSDIINLTTMIVTHLILT